MKTRHADLDNLKEDLKRYYEKKFPNEANKKEEFADFVVLLLNKINKEKPLTILTTSYNLSDGIGDFVNQADFTDWLCQVFAPFENIQVQSISILEQEKFKLASILMPESVKNNGIEMIGNNKDLANLQRSDNKNVFLSYEVANENLDNPGIMTRVHSADLFINLAIYMHLNSRLQKILSEIKRETFTQSRAEYGPLDSKPYSRQLEKKLYYETCMGAEVATTGLKFYKSLQSLCRKNISAKAKEKLAATISNQSIASYFIGEKNHGFAFGYIQSKPYSRLFVRLMIAKSADKSDGVVMMVNLAHFKNIYKDKNFLKYLQENGYQQIKFVGNDGAVREVPVSGYSGVTGKTLTLVEFRGTSQQDKEKIIAMSDMVAGSGNSSFSEMLSASRFPFIQPIRHVRLFYHSFIDEIANANIQHGDLLQQYLLLNINCIDERAYDEEQVKENTDELIKMISDAEAVNKIMTAFEQYCIYLEDKRNAYDDFMEIISTFIMQKGLEMDPAILQQVLTLIPPASIISGYTLLHLCLEKNLIFLANQLIENYPESINAKCMYKNYTPLMMAARYGQYSMVENLLKAGASIHEMDSDRMTIVEQAILSQDLELMKLLLNKPVHENENPVALEQFKFKVFMGLIYFYLDEYLKNNPESKQKSGEDIFESLNKTLLRSVNSESRFISEKMPMIKENINLIKRNLQGCKTVDEVSQVVKNILDKELAIFLTEKLNQADPANKLSRKM